MSEIFLSIGCFLACYEQYCGGFDLAQKTYDQSSQDPNFNALIKQLKTDNPLDSLLMMPVQRIPRYKLLLVDFLKNTPKTHADAEGLEKAVQMISGTASEINEKIRAHEKTATLLEDGKQAHVLAKYVTKERPVLNTAENVEIKIEGTKSMVGKLKCDVYILSDAVLLILKRTAKAVDNPWIDEFAHLFWPMKLIWLSKKQSRKNSKVRCFPCSLLLSIFFLSNQ